MDEVIKELWLNIRTLTGTQWIIVITFSLFIGFGLFALFRWLYSSRFEAQKSLLELKDKTIEYYAGQHTPPVASSSKLPDTNRAIIPENWQPYISQAFKYLEAELDNAMAQQHMNRISADMGFILDAELFVLYVRLFERTAPDSQEALKKEQSKWLLKRSEHAEKSVESHGGSLAPLEYNLAYIDKTKERIAELQSRLELYEEEKDARNA